VAEYDVARESSTIEGLETTVMMQHCPKRSLAALRSLIALLILFLCHPAVAQIKLPGLPDRSGAAESQFNDSRDRVHATAVAQKSKVAPGELFAVAIVFEHDKGWHIWTNEGNVPEGMARFEGAIHTAIVFAKDSGKSFEVFTDQIQWPELHSETMNVGDGPNKYAVFTGKAVAYVPVKVAKNAPLGEATLEFMATFQSCDETNCLAPVFDEPLQVAVEIVEPAQAVAGGTDEQLFAGFDATVFARLGDAASPSNDGTTTTITPTSPQPRPTFFGIPLPSVDGSLGWLVLMLLSMAGGFILNLTPCVLPIIPIKILTISQHAGTPGKSLTLGMWMALGVVAFWAAIGIPAALFTSAADPSRAFGIWWVTLAIGLLIAAMGVGIMGLFTIQLPAAVYSVNPKADSWSGSFLFGVMTAVLGLPCFGFVAGALLAGAATLPPAMIMVIFTSIGIGMAAPYLVLSAKPGWVSKIPRTGPASELVKQVMGLLLLAAAAYFIGSGLITLVLDYPYIGKQLHWWIVALFAVAAGLWLIARTFQISRKAAPRSSFAVIGLLIGGLALMFAINSTQTAKHEWERLREHEATPDGFVAGAWNLYNPARFEKAREAGHVVVLDFTASWCLTCQFLKRTVLDPEPVKSAFEKDDVVVFEVDLSSRSAPGWDALRGLGKTGIPLLAVYAPGEDAPWQANAYTADQVITAVEQARQKRMAAR
jgi:thiol:disulfide interchange protein